MLLEVEGILHRVGISLSKRLKKKKERKKDRETTPREAAFTCPTVCFVRAHPQPFMLAKTPRSNLIFYPCEHARRAREGF